MNEKICKRCRLLKPIEQFGRYKEKPHGQYWCQSCQRDYHKLPEQKQKDSARQKTARGKLQHRGFKLKQAYGLSLAQWEDRFSKQGRVCAICSTDKGPFHTDHSHSRGHVRGILCQKCNHAIGLLGDDPFRVFSALCYLKDRELPSDARYTRPEVLRARYLHALLALEGSSSVGGGSYDGDAIQRVIETREEMEAAQ